VPNNPFLRATAQVLVAWAVAELFRRWALLFRIPESSIFCFVILFLALSGCAAMPQDTDEVSFKKKYKGFDYCKVKVVKQVREDSCGTACLTSLLNYWEIETTEQQILSEFPKREGKGHSILELKDIAISKGLFAYAFSMKDKPEEQLKSQIQQGRPVICAMRFPRNLYFGKCVPLYGPIYRWLVWELGPRKNHYVVVFGLKKDEFLIMDPVHGFVALSHRHFHSCWSEKGYAVLLCARKTVEANP
jgi:predicted double-glycine peptidase